PPTILIVDGDMRFSFTQAQWVQKRGGKTMMAQNGAKAWQILEQAADSIDLVLLAERLSDQEGSALLLRLRERSAWRTLAVIVIATGEEARQHCLAAGAADYLVKPVAEERLLASLLAVLAPVT
ncbi:MAG: response regulator, partial [Magnetococcales bacterium]|nr:response regulator [Magnetococcales bacterium]